ncbi:MAG: hypothetical protein BGO76_01240 [Caedibacter sp. 38-128]|nr:hypothetical protein [Holosporales bacterium]OJX05446.1 MAG: hypothetical protein BGO76_01240 [Caedibacter sp. 38-128]
MKHIFPIISLLLLTACTSYKEGFDCEAVSGVGCKSITEVDHLIDQSKLGADDNSNQENSSQGDLKRNHKPLERTKGMHVWIAPYSDDEEVWHGSQSLFVPLTTNEKEEM